MNPICPYCRTEVGDAEGERKDCPGCGTPHHADCFAENGGCTIFGCAEAPSDEAKVTVAGTDLMGNVATRQTTPTPAPVSRPGLSLGAGYTTFRAPAYEAPPAPPQAPADSTQIAPPPLAGPGTPPPPQAGPYVPPAPVPLVNYFPSPQPKTRVIFVLLGIFLGGLGIHNFYAGYIKKATVQLCITVLTCFYGAALSWPWAIIEICTVNKDADGTEFV